MNKDIKIENIYDYLNIKNKLRNMTDIYFEDFVLIFADKLYNYGFDNLIKDYNLNLKSYEKDWSNLKSKTINTNYINSTNTCGLNIIKKEMPHIYEVKNWKGKSIKNMYTINNLIKAIRINRKSHPTPYVSEIIRQLGFSAGTSKITIYRPLLTKRIIEYFNCKNILDPCVGWGGRMLGTSCLGEEYHYTGCEPCLKTYNGLINIKNKLNLQNVIIHNTPAENILSSLIKEYDLAITSPPYFNLEIYSDELSQSHKYGDYNKWINKFLKPVVYGVLSKLVKGGVSCWSVKNIKTDKKYNIYDDIVRLHLDKGWKKLDIEFYVGNCVRPGSGKDTKGKEITYVFKKD